MFRKTASRKVMKWSGSLETFLLLLVFTALIHPSSEFSIFVMTATFFFAFFAFIARFSFIEHIFGKENKHLAAMLSADAAISTGPKYFVGLAFFSVSVWLAGVGSQPYPIAGLFPGLIGYWFILAGYREQQGLLEQYLRDLGFREKQPKKEPENWQLITENQHETVKAGEREDKHLFSSCSDIPYWRFN